MLRTTLALPVLLLASAAGAGTISVSQIGGGISLTSGPAPVTLVSPAFNPAALIALHNSINASGVNTDGRVTIAALDTGAGLTMIALVDRIATPGVPNVSGLHFDGVSDSSSLPFTTDAAILTFQSPPTYIATGDFTWNANGDGDAFAWGSLSNGTALTWRFQRVAGVPSALTEPETFQFVTWTGSAWSRISVPASQASFSANGEYGFSANVLVPAPGAASLLALAGVAGLRRRRR